MIFINLFVISMSILVTSGNLIMIFLGWELIGLTSFLLINFWNTRISTLKSAFKAFTFNKFSDVCLLIFIISCMVVLQDIDIISINSVFGFYNDYVIYFGFTEINYINFISLFLILCSFVKSAQFGFHIWLPDSMEAPVSASSLIHSATLVSAGIFLMLRFSPLLELSIIFYKILPIIGSFTAFFGGIISCYQSDAKRILAYSTISHCGFLMISTSFLLPEITIIYLYIHGFFKASTFLCAGNIIRFAKNYQDFKKMGMFYKYLPFEYFASFISLLNLAGLPLSIGFFMKHFLIIGLDLLHYKNLIFINIFLGAFTGIIYSFRFIYYIFFDFKKFKKNIINFNYNHKDILISNTTLGSSISIFFLIFLSKILSIFLIESLINFKLNSFTFSNNLIENSQIFELNFISKTLTYNSFFLNILIFFFIFINFFLSFRKNINSIFCF